jgi:nitronate monooxygenase
MDLDELLEAPIVGAPMAGGPTTPALAAAVSAAGGLGFLAAGYKTTDAVRTEIEETRALTTRPFGVNLFFPVRDMVDEAAMAAYRSTLRDEEQRYGARCGDPIWSDDGWPSKLDLVARELPAVVSFTFGCPERELVEWLQDLGIMVWATVTSAAEAQQALATDIDALVLQGGEAGGHQGSFANHEEDPLGVLALVQLVRAATKRPLIAAGGIATAAGIAAARASGASAAQIGSALMLAPEAGTSRPHRRALAGDAPTRLTRAFSGRRARGIVNRFMDEHGSAPAAYPQIHYMTAPLRARARELDDAQGLNLWAGQGYRLAVSEPAAVLVEEWATTLSSL